MWIYCNTATSAGEFHTLPSPPSPPAPPGRGRGGEHVTFSPVPASIMCDWVFATLALAGDMTKTTGYLGELEQMVLHAILQLDDQAFGTNVMDELERRVERKVSRGAMYVTLDRLEEKGMLVSQIGDPTPRRGGRPKRLLTVTPEGVGALRKSRNAWMRLWDGLDSVLEQQ